MTRIPLVALAALTLAACQQEQSPPAVDAVQDKTAAVVGQTSAATMGANTVMGYVPNAAMGDMYEIQAAEIALEKSQNAGVRDLATMIRTDHTAASEAFKPIAAREASNVEMPTGLDERRQGLIDNLRSAAPGDFDRVWLDQQVAAHNEALTLHRGFSDNADAPGLAGHARSVVPKIETHLQQAERLRGAM
jgi:putative membrane protein